MKAQHALQELTHGNKLARMAWQPGEFAFLVPGSVFKVNRPPLLGLYEEGTEIRYRPHIDRCFADGTIGPWTPETADLVAEDWYIAD